MQLIFLAFKIKGTPGKTEAEEVFGILVVVTMYPNKGTHSHGRLIDRDHLKML